MLQRPLLLPPPLLPSPYCSAAAAAAAHCPPAPSSHHHLLRLPHSSGPEFASDKTRHSVAVVGNDGVAVAAAAAAAEGNDRARCGTLPP
uniref:Putative secreted protein n=1 Tax=Anopheles darlingi TaxID=43151 RepID=A0A2M4D786_ANODA